MCAGCPHRGLFYTLSKNKCTVLGDIGCYTLGAVAPLSAMEMTLCMGASVSSIHGFNKALGEESEGKTVAVIGDSTFMHSGMTGLANIAYNPEQFHGYHPGQLHYRNDRSSAESNHGIQHQGRSRGARSIWNPSAAPWDSSVSWWWIPMIWRSATGC